MRSPVNWALLGLVIQRPSYGYELVQRFERTYGAALELSSPSQIYTALDTLARRSLIEEMPGAPQESDSGGVVRQPKPHYQATADGVRGYEEWLIGELGEDRRRSQLFAMELGMLAPTAALRVIERYEQACLQEASNMPMMPSSDALTEAPGGLIARLLREEDRLAVEARLAWIEYARREFKVLIPSSPRPQ
jgi:DNA-binding PadR family transcriptional regulator